MKLNTNLVAEIEIPIIEDRLTLNASGMTGISESSPLTKMTFSASKMNVMLMHTQFNFVHKR